MDSIIISDLEVYYHVGTTDAERANPQRLLLSLEMGRDFQPVAASDNLAETIDYDSVCRRLLRFGDGCHWQLIETLAVDIAEMLREEFKPLTVMVEVKKFIIPQAKFVAVRIRRPA